MKECKICGKELTEFEKKYYMIRCEECEDGLDIDERDD